MESIKPLTEMASNKRNEQAMADSQGKSEGQNLSSLKQSDKLVSNCELDNAKGKELPEENSTGQINIMVSTDQESIALAQEPEEPPDSLSQAENELLLLLDLNSSTDETQVHNFNTTTQNEIEKTKKQGKRKRQKMKKRKPGSCRSCSEHEEEEEAENTGNKIDDNKEMIDNKDRNSEDCSVDIKKDLGGKRRLKKKRKKQGVENESEKDESSDHEVTPKKPNPNYFVAVRVSNPLIHSSVKVIQDSIISHNESLQPALVPISTLHITLMVMHLEAHEVDKAVEVLQSCKSDLINLFDKGNTLSMTFEGLAHFRNEVIFVKINNKDEVEKLKLLATVVRDNYEKNGIPKTDDRPFNPHLTIMKLSRLHKKKKKRIKKIPSESYSAWLECELGKETVSEVLLCSMNHKKDEEGFYHCAGSVDIHYCGDQAGSEPL